MRVLLINDDPSESTQMQDCLSTFGVESEVAPTIAEAQTALYKVRPDIVILDLYMPSRNPNGALGEWLALQTVPPVLALIRPDDVLSGRAAIKSGAHGYLCCDHCSSGSVIELLTRTMDQVASYRRISEVIHRLRDEIRTAQ